MGGRFLNILALFLLLSGVARGTTLADLDRIVTEAKNLTDFLAPKNLPLRQRYLYAPPSLRGAIATKQSMQPTIRPESSIVRKTATSPFGLLAMTKYSSRPPRSAFFVASKRVHLVAIPLTGDPMKSFLCSLGLGTALVFSPASPGYIPPPNYQTAETLFRNGIPLSLAYSDVKPFEFWSGHLIDNRNREDFRCITVAQKGSSFQFEVYDCPQKSEYDTTPPSILARQMASFTKILEMTRSGGGTFDPLSLAGPHATIAAKAATYDRDLVAVLQFVDTSRRSSSPVHISYLVLQRRPDLEALPAAPMPKLSPENVPPAPAPQTKFEDL